MALMCPRCGTDVPNEAMYCPYCSLPKPKRGFADETEHHAEESKPVDQPKPRVALKTPSKRSNKPAKRSTAGPGKPPRRLRVSVLSVIALVALFSVGAYIFVVPMVYSEQAEPKTVLAAMEKLRKSPSNEPGVTIEARLARELETTRRVGNLAAYQGWIVRPIKGTKTKVVLAFSFQEVGNLNRSAEWIADLTNNTFTPQTDMAVSVSNK